MKTTIITGSTTGNTDDVADELRDLLNATLISAADANPDQLADCDLLILGASTWDDGVLQEDMETFLNALAESNVNIPCAAVFGLGDQICYADTFVDGIADMAEALDAKGIRRIGEWPIDDYDFVASRAQNGDRFMGLAIDQENQASKTSERLAAWTHQLKRESAA